MGVEAGLAYPATPESVEIGPADAAVRDLDIDVRLFPRLGLEFAPDHLALICIFVEAEPAFKLVVCHGGRLNRSEGTDDLR